MNKIKYIVLSFGLMITCSFAQGNIASDTSKIVLPEMSYEYVPDLSYDEVADRLSCLELNVPLSYNKVVKSFIDYFSVRDREYTKLMIQRVNLYFPIFEYYLQKHGLPDELKYLAIIESGLNPVARSRVGAAGLWQFMPSTGRLFDLYQDFYIDERLDPYKSTEAACLYLKSLYTRFKDWELVLASYNAGPGKVRRAIRRSGYKKKFWEVYDHLPRETRSYLPQFVAIIYVMNHQQDHNLKVDYVYYPMKSDTIQVSHYVDLKSFAEQLNICYTDVMTLNPALKRGAVPPHAKNYPLRIPQDKMSFLAERRSEILDSAARNGKEELAKLASNQPGSTYGRHKVRHRVRSGEVLGSIAERYHVRVSDLRKWNNIHGNLIRSGQTLNIWVKSGQQQTLASRSPAKPQEVPSSKTHLVQPGDTLWEISLKYKGLTIEKIKQLNNLQNNTIKPGQTLIIG
ncbi:MAG: lytic transglycosylase [Cyclobacteriaceae bacterium]|nr:MAG: lytic transglycosylase [Cyclobacteriaceae bacterium]